MLLGALESKPGFGTPSQTCSQPAGTWLRLSEPEVVTFCCFLHEFVCVPNHVRCWCPHHHPAEMSSPDSISAVHGNSSFSPFELLPHRCCPLLYSGTRLPTSQLSQLSCALPPQRPWRKGGLEAWTWKATQVTSLCVEGSLCCTRALVQAAEPCLYKYYNTYKKSMSGIEKRKHLQPQIITLQICISWCNHLSRLGVAAGVGSPWDGFILACAGSGSRCSQQVRR